MSIALELAYEIEMTLKHIKALKQVSAQQIQAETRWNKKLQSMFGDVFDQVLREFKGLTTVPANDAQRRALLWALQQKMEDISDTFEQESLHNAQLGKDRVVADLKRQGIYVAHLPLSHHVTEIIRDHAFTASEYTLERVIGDVMGNLSTSYDEGFGIDKAAEYLEKEFEDMLDWQLRRIARTETNSFQNQGGYLTQQELGIEYHQWWSAEDERVREEEDADHVEMHGQIVRIGESFSNGLKYPGDRSGGEATIKEWISCRCRHPSWFMPEGKMAPPGKDYFYEGELIDKVA